ncbi:MAG: signal peptidase II [Ruminococcus sp.]|nr:signal peptidase II [Ruminococcus sp.]
MKNYRSILLFFLIPVIQVLSSVRFFRSYRQLLSSAIFILSSFIISLLLYKFMEHFFKGNKNNKRSVYIMSLMSLCLMLLDQTHKYILKITNFNCNIIGELFQIKQTKNENQMAILNYFGIEFNTILIIFFKVFLLAIAIICFLRFKNNHLKIGCTLLISAQASSVLDSLIRGYVLDSFYYYKLVCYDIKDYYVDAGLAIILIAILFEQKRQKENKIDSIT